MDKIRKLLGKNFRSKERMSRHTSFKTGGDADYFLAPDTEDFLVESVRLLKMSGVPYLVLGNMTNLLVSDRGIDGAVVTTKNIKAIKTKENRIFASCGALLSQVSSAAVKASLAGLEFASGIPGTVGGGLVMNAGAYDGEMKDVLFSARAFGEDGIKEYPMSALALGYRKSIFQENGETVLSASFTLMKGDRTLIREKMKDLNARRREKQPLEYPSAGSVFRRPAGDYAAALIEKCGLKGVKVGGAMVSDKHSGFIINFDNATSDDILELIQFIQYTVYEKTGTRLETELKILGRP